MKKANDLIPAARMLANAASIFLRSSRFDHVLADLLGLGLDAEREHPAAGPLEPVHEGGIGQVVGARVAEPLDRQVARDQLVAERGERLDVQRDGVAPEIEELDARARGSCARSGRPAPWRCARGTCGPDGSARRRSRRSTGSRGWSRPARTACRPSAASSGRARADPTPDTARSRKPVNDAVRAVRHDLAVPRRQVRLGTSPSRSSESRPPAASRRLPARRRTCRRPSAARAIDSAGVVEACGPKQNIGAW